MQELIERLEKMGGPDMRIDAVIRQVLDLSPTTEAGLPCTPMYTASIDAAMTLVPPSAVAGDQGKVVEMHMHFGRHLIFATVNYEHHAKGATPALALCIAALKARGTLLAKNGAPAHD